MGNGVSHPGPKPSASLIGHSLQVCQPGGFRRLDPPVTLRRLPLDRLLLGQHIVQSVADREGVRELVERRLSQQLRVNAVLLGHRCPPPPPVSGSSAAICSTTLMMPRSASSSVGASQDSEGNSATRPTNSLSAGDHSTR